MCKIVEDYANEKANELAMGNIKNLFENGGSLELAFKTFQNIAEDIICKIYEEVKSNKTFI